LQIIFQDPYSSLDPRMTVSEIVAEPLRAHRVGDRASQRDRVQELLELVGIEPSYAARYPP
jgi:peptide/nickel transport system ATP-binding protein/oligopeptide transport system ATP-binding protein